MYLYYKLEGKSGKIYIFNYYEDPYLLGACIKNKTIINIDVMIIHYIYVCVLMNCGQKYQKDVLKNKNNCF